MWVPAGVLFASFGLAAFAKWLNAIDRQAASIEIGRRIAHN
jgi:hypothetical protein